MAGNGVHIIAVPARRGALLLRAVLGAAMGVIVLLAGIGVWPFGQTRYSALLRWSWPLFLVVIWS